MSKHVDMEKRGDSSSFVEISDKKWRPWLIPLFAIACTVVLIVTMFENDCPNNNSGLEGDCVAKFLGRFSFQPLKQNPLFGPSTHGLTKMGALEWYKVVHGNEGWRLISCIWLHGGVVHLFANMLSLLFIGIRLEQQFGFVKIGAIYLLSGFGGSVLSSLFLRNAVSVGASGALFGLLGAMFSELLTNWTIYISKAAAVFTLIFIIVINLAIGILPLVDNFAHIGGFLTGFLLGFILLVQPQHGWVKLRNQSTDSRVKSKHKAYQYIFGLIALVLLIVGLTIGLVMLFRGENGNEHCSWCHYLQCVPTSKWDCEK